MTRILGADRVPAGFTITTEACVAYMRADRTSPTGLDDAGRRGAGAAGGAGGQAARRPRRPAARLRAQRRARVDAGHARHGPEPRPQRRVGRRAWPSGPATSASPGTPTGASCRCSATSCAASTASDSRTRSGAPSASAASSSTPSSTPTRCASSPQAFQGALRLPAGPARQLDAGDPRRLRLLEGRARGRLPAHQPHPRRLGHRGQRPADGLRQQGRHARARGVAFSPRRGHRRARAVGRLPRQRAGRGRRLRRAQHARHRRAGATCMPDAHEELLEILRTLEAPLQATCRTRSSPSRRGGSTCSRRATPSGPPRRRCASRSTRSRRACSTREEALATIDAETLDALLHPTFDPQAEFDVLARASPPRRARPRARSSSPPTTRWPRPRRPRRHPRAPVHRGRRRRRLPRREGRPDERGRQGLATRRSSRAAWACRP